MYIPYLILHLSNDIFCAVSLYFQGYNLSFNCMLNFILENFCTIIENFYGYQNNYYTILRHIVLHFSFKRKHAFISHELNVP